MTRQRLRLVFRDTIGRLPFRRYEHPRHGVVETLTKETVVYVRPVFGLLKPDEQPPQEVTEFRARKPKAKRSRRLRRGSMWEAGAAARATTCAGGEA
jgi:hypothetical protein